MLLDNRTTLRVSFLIAGLAHSLSRGSRPGRSSEATTGSQDDRLSLSPPSFPNSGSRVYGYSPRRVYDSAAVSPNPPTAVVAADRTTV